MRVRNPRLAGKLLMDFGESSHRLGSLARMRRVVPGFAGEFGFLSFRRGQRVPHAAWRRSRVRRHAR